MHERPTWPSPGPPRGLLRARCRPSWGPPRARARQRGLTGPRQGSKRRSRQPVTNNVVLRRIVGP
eukprot:8741003-Pyramimonas_sp.AAC.2